MKGTEFLARMQNACSALIAAEKELTEIDARFGDADHGVTMTRIAKALSEGLKADGTIKTRIDNGATNVMMINGGSAVPLWYSLLDGMAQAAPDVGEENDISIEEIKALFAKGCSELAALSKAKVGDKTMMDALLPACDAIAACDKDKDDGAGLFDKAAEAARQGAEASKNFVAKFGRARSYNEQTIGTADAGALSMSYFFVGLANPAKADA